MGREKSVIQAGEGDKSYEVTFSQQERQIGKGRVGEEEWERQSGRGRVGEAKWERHSGRGRGDRQNSLAQILSIGQFGTDIVE